jgi:hypothetical protein
MNAPMVGTSIKLVACPPAVADAGHLHQLADVTVDRATAPQPDTLALPGRSTTKPPPWPSPFALEIVAVLRRWYQRDDVHVTAMTNAIVALHPPR